MVVRTFVGCRADGCDFFSRMNWATRVSQPLTSPPISSRPLFHGQSRSGAAAVGVVDETRKYGNNANNRWHDRGTGL